MISLILRYCQCGSPTEASIGDTVEILVEKHRGKLGKIISELNSENLYSIIVDECTPVMLRPEHFKIVKLCDVLRHSYRYSRQVEQNKYLFILGIAMNDLSRDSHEYRQTQDIIKRRIESRSLHLPPETLTRIRNISFIPAYRIIEKIINIYHLPTSIFAYDWGMRNMFTSYWNEVDRFRKEQNKIVDRQLKEVHKINNIVPIKNLSVDIKCNESGKWLDAFGDLDSVRGIIYLDRRNREKIQLCIEQESLYLIFILDDCKRILTTHSEPESVREVITLLSRNDKYYNLYDALMTNIKKLTDISTESVQLRKIYNLLLHHYD